MNNQKVNPFKVKAHLLECENTELKKENERLKAEISTLAEHDKELEEIVRKRVCDLAKVDLRSLIEAFASSLIGYCIWNKKNVGDNEKIFFNLQRKINNCETKALALFDFRLDMIEKGEL